VWRVRGLLAIGAAVVICSCSGESARVVDPPPALGRGEVERLMLRADDSRREVFAAIEAASLQGVFRGPALRMLEAQVARMVLRGVRAEERNSSRTLVFWDPGANEAVLQVVGQGRLLTPDDPDPPWASTVRQWWARLGYATRTWWVVDQADLAPDRWRSM
jgi:hypothetical protein